MDGSELKIFIHMFKFRLQALLTPLPLIPFTTEEITVCAVEAARDANKTPRNQPSCFLFHLLCCFSNSIN